MNLLIFTPTWVLPDRSLAIHPDCQASIRAQQIDGHADWIVGTDNPYPAGDLRNVLHQYQVGRDQFLASDADALLIVEHDNVLPDPNAAHRLYHTKADVVYGCYMLRHGSNVLNIWRYEGNRNLGQSWSLYPEQLRTLRDLAPTVRVSGVGFGCILIRRRIVENYPFRAGDPKTEAPDIPFAQDVLRAGITSLARMDVLCDHYHEGVKLTPFAGANQPMVKVRAQQTVNVLVDGQVLKMVQGGVYDVPKGDAGELMRAGYAWIESPELPQPESATIEPPPGAVLPMGRKRRAS